MMYERYHYHTIDRVVASYDSDATAQAVAHALREGGARVEVVPNPDGVNESGSIKYKFLIVMKFTVITTQETLVW
mgnify:CR=1 FL=1